MVWGPVLSVFPHHKMPHPDLHPKFLSGCTVGQQLQRLMTWFLHNWNVGNIAYFTVSFPSILISTKVLGGILCSICLTTLGCSFRGQMGILLIGVSMCHCWIRPLLISLTGLLLSRKLFLLMLLPISRAILLQSWILWNYTLIKSPSYFYQRLSHTSGNVRKK